MLDLIDLRFIAENHVAPKLTVVFKHVSHAARVHGTSTCILLASLFAVKSLGNSRGLVEDQFPHIFAVVIVKIPVVLSCGKISLAYNSGIAIFFDSFRTSLHNFELP